jgi:drug/metabolite transporter (DMT)-like permease
MSHTENDSGSVSAVFFFVTGLIFISFYLIMIIYPMTNGTAVAYNAYQAVSVFPISQAHQDSMVFLQTTVNASGVLGFVLMIISFLLVSLREKYGVT